MPSTATVAAEPAREPADMYALRDDLARSYAPANAHERMLVQQIAQSFLRLQRAQQAEARYFENKDILDAITTDFNTYKTITRYVADCERAWRHAVLILEKTQRRRIKSAGAPIAAPQPQPEAAADNSQLPTENSQPITHNSQLPQDSQPPNHPAKLVPIPVRATT